MPDTVHAKVVQESFRHQIDAFSGPDSVYAQREGPLSWIEPLDTSVIALEVACGAAHAAESIAPFVHQVVGLDLTTELLQLGADRLGMNGTRNVLLQEGNAEDLPFVPHAFGLVFCRSSLHHFADPEAAVKEMKRVTKPGGRIVLIDLVVPQNVDRQRFDHLHRLLDPSHVRTYNEDELISVLSEETSLTYLNTSSLRFPIDVAVSENSDRDGVLEALHEEVAGGTPSGFEPVEEDGILIVSFLNCIAHASTATE